MKTVAVLSALLLAAPASAAFADAFTLNSPAGGTLPSTVSAVGGIVTDLVGLNGTRVVAQVSAATEYVGTEPMSSTPNVPQIILFGAQTGITPTLLDALGGGLQSAAFRVTLYDGDNQPPDFDDNQNFLLVGAIGAPAVGTITSTSNGVNLGNFTTVPTHETDGTGTQIVANGGYTAGFGNNLLDTGFFSATDPTTLASLYSSLLTASIGSQVLNFQLRDNTPGNNTYDQFYNFTQGLDASVINIGSGPVVTDPGNPPTTNPVPEPSSLLLLGTGLSGIVAAARSARSNASRRPTD